LQCAVISRFSSQILIKMEKLKTAQELIKLQKQTESKWTDSENRITFVVRFFICVLK
jgi:hypothetical protein